MTPFSGTNIGSPFNPKDTERKAVDVEEEQYRAGSDYFNVHPGFATPPYAFKVTSAAAAPPEEPKQPGDIDVASAPEFKDEDIDDWDERTALMQLVRSMTFTPASVNGLEYADSLASKTWQERQDRNTQAWATIFDKYRQDRQQKMADRKQALAEKKQEDMLAKEQKRIEDAQLKDQEKRDKEAAGAKSSLKNSVMILDRYDPQLAAEYKGTLERGDPYEIAAVAPAAASYAARQYASDVSREQYEANRQTLVANQLPRFPPGVGGGEQPVDRRTMKEKADADRLVAIYLGAKKKWGAKNNDVTDLRTELQEKLKYIDDDARRLKLLSDIINAVERYDPQGVRDAAAAIDKEWQAARGDQGWIEQWKADHPGKVVPKKQLPYDIPVPGGLGNKAAASAAERGQTVRLSVSGPTNPGDER